MEKPAPLDDMAQYAEMHPLADATDRRAANVMIPVMRVRHKAVRDFIEPGVAAAEKKREAVKLKARTQLEAEEKTVEDRKARAALESADAFFDAECAEVVADAMGRELFLLKDDWDTARSVTATARAEKSATEGFGS